MRQRWEEMQLERPETKSVINVGLAKLREYEERAFANPTYTVATSTWFLVNSFFTCNVLNYILVVLNPAYKLEFFDDEKDKQTAKAVFLAQVYCFIQMVIATNYV